MDDTLERIVTDGYSSPAQVVSRQETQLSPWVRLIAKDIRFEPAQAPQLYHNLLQNDYLAILARTISGLFPIVRQYRPAVEAYTWELPAATVEPGELPADCCRRELREEAGVDAIDLTYLGSSYPDTGRLGQLVHTFFVQASNPVPNFVPEPGMVVEYVSGRQLVELVRRGIFRHQLHLGALVLAMFSLSEFSSWMEQ